MNYFCTGRIGRSFILSLNQGDLLLESVGELVQKENVRSGIVVSAIGTLDRCTPHMVTTTGYPTVEHFETWTDTPLELSSMSGFIADGQPHLHAVVSDKNMAFSGHVEENCRILYLAEIVIMELPDADLVRLKDDRGINKLAVQQLIQSAGGQR